MIRLETQLGLFHLVQSTLCRLPFHTFLLRMSRPYRPALLVRFASALHSDSVYLWAFIAFLEAALGVFWDFLLPHYPFSWLLPLLVVARTAGSNRVTALNAH